MSDQGLARTAERLGAEWRALAWRTNGGAVPPGRNDLPAALFDAYYLGHAFADRPDLLGYAAADAYGLAEWPCQNVDAHVWRTWFEEAGYTENGLRTERPARVPTLWRAYVLTDSGNPMPGLSWTEERGRAEVYHRRNLRYGWPSVLARLDDAHPAEVLARGHEEAEWMLTPESGSRAEAEVTA